jgi:hypothetical protein
MGGAVNEPPSLMEDHAGPLSFGSHPIRVEEATRPLKHTNKDTEEKGVSQDHLERNRDGLEQKPDLLTKAKEKIRKGIQKVKRIFSVRIGKY